METALPEGSTVFAFPATRRKRLRTARLRPAMPGRPANSIFPSSADRLLDSERAEEHR